MIGWRVHNFCLMSGGKTRERDVPTFRTTPYRYHLCITRWRAGHPGIFHGGAFRESVPAILHLVDAVESESSEERFRCS